MHIQRKFFVALFALCGLVAVHSSSAVEPPVAEWIEVTAQAIKVHARAAFGYRVQISTAWRPVEEIGWSGKPGAKALAVTFSLAAAKPKPVVVYYLVPWQSLSRTGDDLGHFITVTGQILVFGPYRGRHLTSAQRKLARASEKIVFAATDRDDNERQIRASVPQLADDFGQRDAVVKRHYVAFNISHLPTYQVAHGTLAAVATGKMILLSTGGVTPTHHWIAPSPRAPSPSGGKAAAGGINAMAPPTGRLDRDVRALFSETLKRALKTAGTNSAARQPIFRQALRGLEAVILNHPNHQGPAYAAGAVALQKARRRLARMMAVPNRVAEVRSRGYQPKLAPDNVLDYRPSLRPQLAEIPPAEVGALPKLIDALNFYKARANRNPGQWRNGRIDLGANAKEYSPSNDELLAAVAGERIAEVAKTAVPTEIRNVLGDPPANSVIEYIGFGFRHADVMGTGRYYYSSAPKTKRVVLDP